MVVTDAAVNVLIVSAHPISRFGLKKVVESSFLGCSVKTFAYIEEMASEMESVGSGPVTLVFDASVFDRKVLTDLEYLNKHYPDLLIVVFLNDPNIFQARQLLEAGVKGIVNNLEPLDYLQSCLITVLNGGRYLSLNLVNAMVDGLVKFKHNENLFHLSRRQHEIFKLLVQGYGTNEISKVLNLKPSTVSTQKKIIIGKLGIENRTDFSAYLDMAC